MCCLRTLQIISDRLTEFQKELARKSGNQSNGDNAHVGNGSIEHGSPKRRRAFLDLLLGLYSEDKITFAEIKEEVDTFMFAVKEDSVGKFVAITERVTVIVSFPGS